jgi:hypothetical protein
MTKVVLLLCKNHKKRKKESKKCFIFSKVRVKISL